MSQIVCAVHLGVRRGVFIFELSWEHSATLLRKIFLFTYYIILYYIEEDVHKSNQVFTL